MMKISSIIQKRWFNHYKIKTFSLLSALILWLYVITNNNFEHTLKVPIYLINKPKNWMLTQPIPSFAKVLFRGSGKALLSLHYRKKHMDLNIGKIRKKASLPLSVEMIQEIPKELDVIPIKVVEPESIHIELDRFIHRKLPIELQITMIPMDGYIQVGDINVEPDSVVVSGPKSLVNNLNGVVTEDKAYRNLIKPIKGKIQLITPEQETVRHSLKHINFRADIQRIGEKTISEIPVQIIRLPKNTKATVVPSTLSLKLQGGVKILSKIKREDVTAAIDFRTRNRYNRKKIPAIIKLPPEISLSDVRPEFFELVVER